MSALSNVILTEIYNQTVHALQNIPQLLSTMLVFSAGIQLQVCVCEIMLLCVFEFKIHISDNIMLLKTKCYI